MYRVGVEAILGIAMKDGGLDIDPCIPRTWPGFEATFNRRDGDAAASIRIVVENPHGVNRGVARLELDGVQLDPGPVPIAYDGRPHVVKVTLGHG
jgi:cyclic beta-1,2-glucan synthetase